MMNWKDIIFRGIGLNRRGRFEKLLKSAKFQFLIKSKGEQYFLHLNRPSVFNDLGIVATNEKTGVPDIVLLEDIELVIVDGQEYKMLNKSN